MKAMVVLAACAAGFLLLGAGSQPAAPSKEPAATASIEISAVAFVAGQWRGQTEDGTFEEHWSKPEGNNAMGMFRWLKPDGTPVMFEMLAITRETDGIYLRLMHFNAKMVGREEKDGATTLKLAESSPSKAVFKAVESEKHLTAVVYERTASGGLHITVQFPDPSREPLNFDLHRIPADGK